MRNKLNSYKEKITKEEISLLPVNKFEGEIYVVDNVSDVAKCAKYLKQHSVLGFDTETKPSFKKGQTNKVSLLQLSTHERAYLFRLNKIGLPNELCDVLSDQEIEKVGVAISDDITSLQRLNPFPPLGYVELQQYVKYFGIEDNGLKKLTANILGFNISKRQQTSNWEADMLNEKQAIYAATDAWVCFEIYDALNKHIPEEDIA